MKSLILIVPLALFSACSSTEQITDLTLPQLLYQHPLPPFPKQIFSVPLRIDLEIYVAKNGSVEDARVLAGSGSTAWDSATAVSIRQWKYTPARNGEKPISIWLHQTAIVTFSDPKYLSLAEILCSSSEDADSAYAMLEQGVEFADIVMRYSVADSRDRNGLIGTVNIQVFPEPVKKILARLESSQFTKPTRFGEHYAIFKRLKD